MLSKPNYEITVMEDVMIPMRDNIRLATDVYLPSKHGVPIQEPLPVILERTPYNKRALDAVERNCRYFTRRGYIYAFQDCRGCFNSEGDFDFLWQEGPDGYDTIEWIASQPWCNGKIGTTGTSYAGWVQNALAIYNPDHLTCMWVNQAASNGYTSSLRHNGALELRFLTWLYWHAAINTNTELKNDSSIIEALNNIDTRILLSKMPLDISKTPLSIAPGYKQRAIDLLTQGDFNDLWKSPSINFQLYWDNFADVPTVFSSSWYDSYTRANIENYVALSKRNKGPYRLIMGSWLHGDLTMADTSSGNIDLGPKAPINYNEERLRWFDHWLKEIDNGVEKDKEVRLFTMGKGNGLKNIDGRLNHGGYWREEREWPLNQTQYVNFYLQPDGTLHANSPSEKHSSTTYSFNPNDPVPTIGGNISSLSTLRSLSGYTGDPSVLPQAVRVESIVSTGGWNQRILENTYRWNPEYGIPLSSRKVVLVFKTPPLLKDVEVTGPLVVNLWISSSAPDTDFTAKLIDFYPPTADYPEGFALNISDSIFRMRYRDSWEKPALMVAEKIYSVTITLYPTSNIFVKGHSIRLDISSSNFPRFDINPNTGEPLGQNTYTQSALNTIHHNIEYPSHVTLPIVG